MKAGFEFMCDGHASVPGSLRVEILCSKVRTEESPSVIRETEQ